MFSNQIIPPFATQKDNSRQKSNDSPQKTKPEEVVTAQVPNEPSSNTLQQLVLSLSAAEVPKTEKSNAVQQETKDDSNKSVEDANKAQAPLSNPLVSEVGPRKISTVVDSLFGNLLSNTKKESTV